MLKHISTLKRLSFGGLGALFLLTSSLAAFFALVSNDAALAGGQVTSRQITMSDSNPGDSSVTYAVSFKPTSNTAVGGIVVDFCANDPIVGDTSCTMPTGFTMGSTPAVSSINGIGTGGTWTPSGLQCAAPASNTQALLLTNTTAQAPTNYTTTPITFNITGVTNPSGNGSFYARILTFDTGANTTSQYTCSGATRPATYANMMDSGGVALSTTQNIAIEAKVFETLAFCVYQTACGTQANLTLGDTTTGALSSTSAYVNDNAKYTLATNAGSGVSVQMFGTTLCRVTPLDYANCPSGASSNTITAMGTSEAALTTGSEQFGMCVQPISGTTAQSPYNDSGTGNNCSTGITTGAYSGSSKFGFDDTNTTGTNSAGGSNVLTSSGPVNSSSGQFAFMADISSTTEAGIYQSNLNMVATGQF